MEPVNDQRGEIARDQNLYLVLYRCWVGRKPGQNLRVIGDIVLSRVKHDDSGRRIARRPKHQDDCCQRDKCDRDLHDGSSARVQETQKFGESEGPFGVRELGRGKRAGLCR